MRLARPGATEGEWRERLVREEGQGWAAQGRDLLLAAETVDRRRVQGIAIGGLGLAHAYVREWRLMLQQLSVGAAGTRRTRRQSGRAIQARIQAHGKRRGQGQGLLFLASRPPPAPIPTRPTQFRPSSPPVA